MYVCICFAITDETVRSAIAEGARSLAEVARSCRAGDDCGACRGRIAELIEDDDDANDRDHIRLPICPPTAA